MPIRQFLTTGVAFATVGMVAAIPAIAPPLQPRDVQVAKATEAQVKLAAGVFADPTLKDLVNVYFGVSPDINPSDDPTKFVGDGDGRLPVVYPRSGTSGATGVIYQLLFQAAGGDTEAAQAVDSLFTQGMAKVIENYLLSSTTDPLLQNEIRAWFEGGINRVGGGSLLVRQLLIDRVIPSLAGPLSAPLQVLVNEYFSGGATELAFLGLEALSLLDPTHNSPALVNALFKGIDVDGDGIPDINKGVTSVIYTALQQNAPDAAQPILKDYFSGGLMQVAKTQLDAALPDSGLKDAVDAYVDGGAFGLVHQQLTSSVTDPTAQGVLDEYFDNGMSGVVRFLLTGPAPTAPEPVPTVMLAKSFAASEGPELVSEPEAPKPDDSKVEALSATSPAVDTKPVATLPATPVAVTAPAPAAAPAPVAETPVPADDPKPAAADDATEVMKNGGDFSKNGDDELILLPDGTRPKDRPHSWGVFGKVAKAIADGLSGGKAGPAAGAPAGGAGEGAGGAEG